MEFSFNYDGSLYIYYNGKAEITKYLKIDKDTYTFDLSESKFFVLWRDNSYYLIDSDSNQITKLNKILNQEVVKDSRIFNFLY